MKYDEYKDNIKSGDLLAWSTTSLRTWHDLVGRTIRVFTQSEYEHVGIAWVVAGRVFVVEAVHPCVRIYPLSRLRPFYIVHMGVTWREELEAFLLSNVGSPYSILAAIKSYFKPLKADGEWQCAELAMSLYQLDNRNYGEDYTPSGLIRNVLESSTTGMILVK